MEVMDSIIVYLNEYNIHCVLNADIRERADVAKHEYMPEGPFRVLALSDSRVRSTM